MKLMAIGSQPTETSAILKQFLAETVLYDRAEFVLTNETPLIAQRILDSLQIFQLIAFLRQRFDFTVEAEDMLLENFASINAITALLHKPKTAQDKESA